MAGNRVIFLSGPTGVGKSVLAIKLAALLKGEVISCDSVQIYRHLNIGSNKTTETQGIPHHLIDCVDWWEDFSAASFYAKCTEIVKQILQRGKIPILVGGTGMYMNWVLDGRPSSPPTSTETLAKVKCWIEQDASWDASLERLQKLDPEYAASLNRNDFYRLARALTVNLDSGKPLAEFKPQAKKNGEDFVHHLGWNPLCLYLTTDRKYLYRLVDWRCELMIQSGLLGEIAALKRQGFCSKYISAKSIGYNEGLEFLEAVQESEDLICKDKFMRLFAGFLEKFQAESRKYARRQDSWFAKDKRFFWLPRNTPTTALFSFPDAEPFIYAQRKECTNLDSLAQWIYQREGSTCIQANSDCKEECKSEFTELSCLAQSFKRTNEEMKRYKTALRIYTTPTTIEQVYLELQQQIRLTEKL